jgi:protein-disulfide isomerase
MTLLYCWRRLALAALLVCMGCRDESRSQNASGQQAPAQDTSSKKVSTDVARRLETVVRAAMNVPPHIDMEIGERTPSDQFPGYDNLPVNFVDGGKKMPVQFVISKDDKTLFSVTKYDISSEAVQKKRDEMRQIMEKIDLRGRPVRGSKNAKVLIVSYDDLECPYCTMMHQALFPAVLNRYGDKIRVVYKDFPLDNIHPWARHAALDSSCLARQNGDAYWGFVDYVHAHQPDINQKGSPEAQSADLDRFAIDQARQHGADASRMQSCLNSGDQSAVDASFREGQALGIDSTPTVFVNGLKINGTLSVPDLEKIIDQALLDAGVAPPASAPIAAGQ